MKTALITGASRGIGAATARYFAERGWRVVANYSKSEDRARALADEIGCDILRADVGNPDDCRRMIEFVLEKYGRIDALVNNAAVSEVGLFTDISEERAARLMEVNLVAPMRLSRLVLPSMIREKSGVIVNISSMWGQVGASCEVDYSASKAGLIGFTKALAAEVAPSGIRVNCVAPGVIETEMNSHLSDSDKAALADEIPMCRIGLPEEVAECVYFLCESASYVTGQVLAPNGGFVM